MVACVRLALVTRLPVPYTLLVFLTMMPESYPVTPLQLMAHHPILAVHNKPCMHAEALA